MESATVFITSTEYIWGYSRHREYWGFRGYMGYRGYKAIQGIQGDTGNIEIIEQEYAQTLLNIYRDTRKGIHGYRDTTDTRIES